MEEDLPNVPQFIQVHVGQTDERKRQEGLAVPPDGEVDKQVALKETGSHQINAEQTGQRPLMRLWKQTLCDGSVLSTKLCASILPLGAAQKELMKMFYREGFGLKATELQRMFV